MRNKTVGWIIIGLAAIIGIIVFLFNNAMTNIVSNSCSMGPTCSMYGQIKVQTWISMIIIGIIAIIGTAIMFMKPSVIEKIKKVQIEKKHKPVNYSKLDKEEKVLVKVIEENEGSIFQAELVEKSGYDKVKVTRILDRLEGKQIIERKRRGMTNVVLLR